MTRIAWIDYLKALGICLVVYGHSRSTSLVVGKWIYSFHMPLFFLLSGYLISKSGALPEFRVLAKKAISSLVPAYLFFSVVGYLSWILVLRNFGDDAQEGVSPVLTFLAILYGTGTPPSIHLHPLVLWFFPCLLTSQIIAFALLAFDKVTRIAWSVVLAGIGFMLPRSIALPMEFESALVAQLFVILGFEAKRVNWIERFSNQRLLWGSLFMVVGCLMGYINSPVDMRTSQYGNWLYFTCGALGLSIGLAVLLSALPASPFATFISSNTIILFPLHPLIFSVFSAIYVFVFKQDLAIREKPIVGFVATIVNCSLILLFIVPLIRRRLPWVFGVKNG